MDTVSRLNDHEMSYHEYQDFFPMADEVSLYLVDLIEEEGEDSLIQRCTSSQAVSLVNFGTKFEIGEKTFWNFVLDIVQKENTIKGLSPNESLHLLGTLKEFDILPSTLLVKLTQQLVLQAQQGKLSTTNLTLLLLIVTSDPVKDSYENS